MFVAHARTPAYLLYNQAYSAPWLLLRNTRCITLDLHGPWIREEDKDQDQHQKEAGLGSSLNPILTPDQVCAH